MGTRTFSESRRAVSPARARTPKTASNPLAVAEHPEQIGDYRIERELGRGAMGVVYLAVHPTLGRQIALKVMPRELAADPEFLERFRREGTMAARLRHPNIVAVYDFAQRDGLYFIAMEYLGSRTLKDLLRDEKQQPVERSCRIVNELLSALSCAHAQGIVHRDIKPANIMLTDSGPIALTDFSVAHMKESSKLTQTGAVIGTPEYMAPEQFEGSWDARTDLYAVGIVFYELLTGFSPFRSNTITECMRKQLMVVPDPPAEVDFSIPLEISQIVSRALEKERDARFQSADEMRLAIESALAHWKAGLSPDQAPPASSPAAAPLPPSPVIEAPSHALEAPPSSAPRFEPAPSSQTGGELTPLRKAPKPPGEPPPAPPPPPSEPMASPTPEPAAVGPPDPERPRRSRPLRWVLLAAVLGTLTRNVWLPPPEAPDKSASTPTPSPRTATPAPTAAPEQPPSPSPLGSATTEPDPWPSPAEATPVATSSPALPGTFPQEATIVPGVGVGDVRLGQTFDEVRAAWGPPEPGASPNPVEAYWSYSGQAANLVFVNGRLARIAVGTPDFPVEGLGVGLGVRYRDVLAAFPDPTTRTDNDLDYNSLGIYFHFNAPLEGETVEDEACGVINVYEPGQTIFAPEPRL